MKIFRIFLLAAAMAVFVMNFLTIDYNALLSSKSLWAYFRVGLTFVLILLLVVAIKKDMGKKKRP